MQAGRNFCGNGAWREPLWNVLPAYAVGQTGSEKRSPTKPEPDGSRVLASFAQILGSGRS